MLGPESCQTAQHEGFEHVPSHVTPYEDFVRRGVPKSYKQHPATVLAAWCIETL